MATYCISDIHGRLPLFTKILQLVHFSKNDHLYVIGDCIDRGESSLATLELIQNSPNMTLLMGNHELMCIQTLGEVNVPYAKDCWIQNGGFAAYQEISASSKRKEIIEYLESLPASLNLQINQQSFHLVHGFPGKTIEDQVWSRIHKNSISPLDGTMTIVGHTPTHYLDPGASPYRMFHGQGFIDVDCGCGHQSHGSRLGCLRLDDLQEFYV